MEIDLGARFWSKVDKEGPLGPLGRCWLWIAGKNDKGYGYFNVNEKTCRAHIVSYEAHKGPVPDGFEIDHLCRVRHCVNPAHLEAVTHAENIRRGDVGITTGKINLAKKDCPQGHSYSGENLYITPAGYRQCRICHRESDRKRYIRKKKV